MKERDIAVTNYKTKYFSDDGCFSSWNKEEVEEYEKKLSNVESEPVFLGTFDVDGEQEYFWSIYKCDDFESFKKMLSDFTARKYIYGKDTKISNLLNLYSADCKHYGITCVDEGDNGEQLYVSNLSELLKEVRDNINSLDKMMNELTTTEQSLNQILDR